MKKTMIFILLLLSVGLFFSCKPTGGGDDLAWEAINSVSVEFQPGDSASSVTKNIYLETLVTIDSNEIEINWESDNVNVISNTGVVTRPEEDTNVELTASATFDGDSASKKFALMVKGTSNSGGQKELLYDITFEVGTASATAITAAQATGFMINPNGATISDANARVYPGNESSGAFQGTDFLKLGSSGEVGQMTISLPEAVSEVALLAHNWYAKSDQYPTTTGTVNLAGSTEGAQSHPYLETPTPTEVVFTFAEPVSSLNIVLDGGASVGNARLFLFGVKAWGIEGGGADNPVQEAINSVSIGYQSGDSASSVTGNVTLPTSSNSIAITWESNNTSVISNTGVVNRPQANTNVKLTASATHDGKSASKSFTLTVKGTSVGGDGSTHTLIYSGATGNMVDGNNASLVNLNASEFNVVSTKHTYNNPGTHVGLNKDGSIRLYSARTTGDGNILTVTSSIGDITSITLSTATNGSPLTYTINSGSNVTLSSTTPVEATYQINGPSFAIQNTTMGDTSTQLLIYEIEIIIGDGGDGGDGGNGEISSSLISAFGFDVSAYLPAINSSDFEAADWDEGEGYSPDFYIDLYDWSLTDFNEFVDDFSNMYEVVYYDELELWYTSFDHNGTTIEVGVYEDTELGCYTINIYITVF